jgi:hypothetical protein
MPLTTSGGENAVFRDGVTQLRAGETEDACVAFSASNIWYSVQPGKTNPYSAEDIDRLADAWYIKLTHSIDNSAGLSLDQLHTILDGMGLKWEPIPITNNGAANDEAVRQKLREGKLVAVCAAESSFFDLELGGAPYSWNTKPFNHCIVASGLITSGPWVNNVWVRDTVAVSGGYRPSTKRPYDIGRMQYVSLTAVVPAWLKGATTMPGIPAGWKDDGQTLTAPNGHKVVLGIRAHILTSVWDPKNVPQEEEHHQDPLEQFFDQPNNTGQQQVFLYSVLNYSSSRGVYEMGVGNEFLGLRKALAALQ